MAPFFLKDRFMFCKEEGKDHTLIIIPYYIFFFLALNMIDKHISNILKTVKLDNSNIKKPGDSLVSK